jgi:prepilin-type N-terminal cleavage/methylation domain-containing protein/prepilin-type processing-associated H-X9-DG protein
MIPVKSREAIERHPAGFTLIELMIVIAVISLLVSMLMPAIQIAREAARRLHCSNNLHQIGIAFHEYESIYNCLPSGSTHKYAILPMLGLTTIYEKRNLEGWDSSLAWNVLNHDVIPVYHCPSDPAPEQIGDSVTMVATTNYSACSGTGIQRDGFNGMFNLGHDHGPNLPGGFVKFADVTDGLSNTAAMSEILHATVGYGDFCTDRLRAAWMYPVSLGLPSQLDEFADACDALPPSPADYGYLGMILKGVPWWKGDSGTGMYNHILNPNRPSCTNGGGIQTGCYTATSLHAGGVNVQYGDGHIQFIAQSIDRAVWREIGSRCQTARIQVR